MFDYDPDLDDYEIIQDEWCDALYPEEVEDPLI